MSIEEAATQKDKHALMFFGGQLESPVLIEDSYQANLADLVLGRTWEDVAPESDVAGRACLGFGLFSEGDWSELMDQGLDPTELVPEMASEVRVLYPPSEMQPPLVRRDGEVVVLSMDSFQSFREEGVFPFEPTDVAATPCEL